MTLPLPSSPHWSPIRAVTDISAAPRLSSTRRRNSRNRYSESCGPGAASGWYWTLKAFRSRELEPFARAVVQVHVRDLGVRRERRRVDGEPVILRGDLDVPRLEVLDGLVAAVVAELELERACPDRLSEELVAEADPEDRSLAEEVPHARDLVVQHGGVAGAVREEHAVGLLGEHLLRRRGRGKHRHAEADLGQRPEDVLLRAVVERDDVRRRRRPAGVASAGCGRRSYPSSQPRRRPARHLA